MFLTTWGLQQIGSLLRVLSQQLDARAQEIYSHGRAERLVSNLLDQARAEARQQYSLYRQADLAQLFARIQHVALGMAHYYTDPPVPVQFTIHPLADVVVDSEEIERAVLNLLDNALALLDLLTGQ